MSSNFSTCVAEGRESSLSQEPISAAVRAPAAPPRSSASSGHRSSVRVPLHAQSRAHTRSHRSRSRSARRSPSRNRSSRRPRNLHKDTPTPMNTLHNFIKQMEVDDSTATDFTRMRSQDQYLIAAQGTLKGPRLSQTLRDRAANLRAWQNRSNSVSVTLQDEFGASYGEYRRWQRTLGK